MGATRFRDGPHTMTTHACAPAIAPNGRARSDAIMAGMMSVQRPRATAAYSHGKLDAGPPGAAAVFARAPHAQWNAKQTKHEAADQRPRAVRHRDRARDFSTFTWYAMARATVLAHIGIVPVPSTRLDGTCDPISSCAVRTLPRSD